MSFFEQAEQYAAETAAEDARILTVQEAVQEILNRAIVSDGIESEQYVTIPVKWLRKLEQAVSNG